MAATIAVDGVNLTLGNKSPKVRIFKLLINDDEYQRLDRLTKYVSPKRKNQVVRTSLQILEELLREAEEGSEFYIRRNGMPPGSE